MAWKKELNKEELGAVERLNKLTNKEILYGNRYGIIIEDFKRLQKDIVIVLSRLEENLTEIHNLRDVITSKIMHIAKHKIIQEKNKEIKEKDKQIDLMAEFLSEKDLGYYKKTGNGNYRKFNKEDWKKFFEEEE